MCWRRRVGIGDDGSLIQLIRRKEPRWIWHECCESVELNIAECGMVHVDLKPRELGLCRTPELTLYWQRSFWMINSCPKSPKTDRRSDVCKGIQNWNLESANFFHSSTIMFICKRRPTLILRQWEESHNTQSTSTRLLSLLTIKDRKQETINNKADP
jgi:hypothetical protein